MFERGIGSVSAKCHRDFVDLTGRRYVRLSLVNGATISVNGETVVERVRANAVIDRHNEPSFLEGFADRGGLRCLAMLKRAARETPPRPVIALLDQ